MPQEGGGQYARRPPINRNQSARSRAAGFRGAAAIVFLIARIVPQRASAYWRFRACTLFQSSTWARRA